MKRTLTIAALLAFVSGSAAIAQNVEVKTLAEATLASADHTTLSAAVQVAGLTETLQTDGPYTILAPDDVAFSAVSTDKIGSLFDLDREGDLKTVVGSHILKGILTAQDIFSMAAASADGFTELDTVSGHEILAEVRGNDIYLYDEVGNVSLVKDADTAHANGIIHVVDTVLAIN